MGLRPHNLRPHGKQAARKTVDKAGVNTKIANEATRLDGRIDDRYTKSEIDNNFYDASESYSAAQVDDRDSSTLSSANSYTDSAVASAVARAVNIIYPSLANGWSRASGYRILGYYRDHDGRRYFRGVISGGTIADGTQLFRLNSSVWPADDVYMPVADPGGAGRVTIDTEGYVRVYGLTNSFVSFDGASF